MNKSVKDVVSGCIIALIGLAIMIGSLYLGEISAFGALIGLGIGFLVILGGYKVAKGPKEVRLVS